MKNSGKILIAALFIVIAIIGCSESPNDLGSDILKDDFGQDIIVLKEYNSHDENLTQSSENFVGTDTVSSHSGGLVTLGHLDNIDSKFLIKFGTTLNDSVLIPLQDDEITVLSAKIKILPKFFIGNDDPSQFKFEVYELSEEIDTELQAGENVNITGINLVSNIESTDSLITAELNPAIVTQWLDEKKSDSTANYGVLFAPVSGSNSVIRIDANYYGDTDNLLSVEYIIKKDESWEDTLEYNPVTRRTLIEATPAAVSDDLLLVQGGVPSRVNYYFDKEQLPQQIAVNEANLFFYVDENESLLRNSGSDSLELSFYINETKDTLDFGLGSAYLVKSEDGKSFTGNVTYFIEKMIEEDYKYGFRIRSRSEKLNVSKIVLNSEKAADPALRPKLTINYSKKNK